MDTFISYGGSWLKVKRGEKELTFIVPSAMRVFINNEPSEIGEVKAGDKVEMVMEGTRRVDMVKVTR